MYKHPLTPILFLTKLQLSIHNIIFNSASSSASLTSFSFFYIYSISTRMSLSLRKVPSVLEDEHTELVVMFDVACLLFVSFVSRFNKF